MAESNVSYQDAEYQGDQEKISFQLIVLNHLNSILKLSRSEWRGGYNVLNHRGDTIYIEDTRARYWNAINSLNDICLPYFDDKMKKAEETHDKKMSRLFDKWHVKNKVGLPVPVVPDAEEKFKDEKVILKRELFRDLSCFLKRKSYFSEETEEDRI